MALMPIEALQEALDRAPDEGQLKARVVLDDLEKHGWKIVCENEWLAFDQQEAS